MTTAAPRRLELVRLGDLVPADRNPKDHDHAAIGRSLAEFGYVEPIVLDERTGKLVAGHGRTETLAAAEAHGLDRPEGVEVDDDGAWLVWVVRGWSSTDDAHAEAYLVASNRLTELGGWDDDALASILADRVDLLEFTGYTRTDLDDLLALRAGPPSAGDLADEYRPPAPPPSWLRLELPAALIEAWRTHRAGYESDADAMRALLP